MARPTSQRIEQCHNQHQQRSGERTYRRQTHASGKESKEERVGDKRACPQTKHHDVHHELHKMQTAVVGKERNDGSEQYGDQRHNAAESPAGSYGALCTLLLCAITAISQSALLGISQSALHIPYYRLRRERSPRHGIHVLRHRLVNGLALPTAEQLLRTVEEARRLGVWLSLNGGQSSVLIYMYLQRHRSAVALHVLREHPGVHHKRSIGLHLQCIAALRY